MLLTMVQVLLYWMFYTRNNPVLSLLGLSRWCLVMIFRRLKMLRPLVPIFFPITSRGVLDLMVVMLLTGGLYYFSLVFTAPDSVMFLLPSLADFQTLVANLANQSYFAHVLPLQIFLLTNHGNKFAKIFLANTYSASIHQSFPLPEFCALQYIHLATSQYYVFYIIKIIV